MTTPIDSTPKPSRIRRYPFDGEVVELVAESLGSAATLAPFQLPGGTVYQLTVENAHGKPATMLTLWPSIRRVDAISPSSAVVFTDVRTVDIVGDVEVQFRRLKQELLIVARGGKVIVRA